MRGVTTRLLGLLQETKSTKSLSKTQRFNLQSSKVSVHNQSSKVSVHNQSYQTKFSCSLPLSLLAPRMQEVPDLYRGGTRPPRWLNHRHLEDKDLTQQHTRALSLHTQALNWHTHLQTKQAEPTSPKRVRHSGKIDRLITMNVCHLEPWQRELGLCEEEWEMGGNVPERARPSRT